MKVKTRTFITAYKKEYNGNVTQFTRYLNTRFGVDLTISAVFSRIKSLKNKGKLPLDSGNSVPINEQLKGTSTLYDSEGEVKLQWVKTDVAKETLLEQFDLAIDLLINRIEPVKPTAAPVITDEQSMTVYTIGDAHIGMLAHQAETGNDNDLKIVETDLLAAMKLLVAQSSPTQEAFIVDVGDWFHSDNQGNTTAKSNNKLDVDGRYHKVLDVGLHLSTKLIDNALKKHQTVRWRSAIGNHDEHSSIMLTAFIKAYYRNEPRVIVHDTPNVFMYHQFGVNLIGITHGHTVKPDKLGEIMAVDCEHLWSDTKYRFW